ncbi:5-oxopent-3-ene-1,2,5-tricarboxylate decarboxylase [Rhodococcus sp. 05-340-1]|nr:MULTISPECIES: fumarylacetoacetate hydrolase family protein [Rhodococcus]OZC96319.1 5-oxopent-3-ene-1,2,5-tricarboxylate decarboxylase [Rhodococcus sp. 06-412-2B]OZC87668.1 5-oxopent-3-ene-1,2,5-tricarboxylate decarboxylase [Rhodococcus sp. 06-412-2C]OZD65444.1 5-oxopent-3-ene-1,2,5-tricarboxylate decarboxylase [Rhodococcus sp. 05-340-2]OZD74689.1 5-oxopent-3-ene-1,2,5-tricarboxylate decarboxylase [Rhodococcus sp. 05-340-1]OZD86575.1 5-oxopent-3-ene-1,2,5-tricarboxylate decarboxylase [Rhodoc
MVIDGQQITVASVDGATVHDISTYAGPDGLAALLDSVDLADITGIDLSAYPEVDAHRGSWMPPIPSPNKILCVGLNFSTHASEVLAEVSEHPTLFTRFPTSFVGHHEPLVRPRVSHTLDWEGEIAVVIGTRGRNIAADEALDHIAGYTVMGENSIREWQLHSKQATAGKNFDRSGSWGPWIITRDEIPDPSALEIVTELNGEQVQHGKLADLVSDIGTIIAYVSTFTELAPGDVIATGTPSGIGHRRTPPRYLAPGDRLVVRIPELLELTNDVSDDDIVP